MSGSLGQRTVSSVAWTATSSLAGLGVLFARSVLLARILPVDVFGVYAGATAIVAITAILPTFGMGAAFLHRSPETLDEDRAAAVHFLMKAGFTLAWAVVMILAALWFTTGDMRTALVVLTLTRAGVELTQTAQLILTRRVMHRRLAMIQLVDTLLTTVAALGLAARGAGLWALLATDVVGMILSIVGLYLWQPVWRIRLAWEPAIARYFLRFGSRNVLAGTVLVALDKVDDLWTQVYLGATALGFYSRAFTFATYPRKILAAPINQVTGGTYAELKHDRLRLSQAFFRANALLVRTGFLLAGLLALIAPEFIRLLLGERWLPMLQAFRLMLLYTMFDPMKLTISDLFLAVGRPDLVLRVRVLQLIIMVAGLFLLGLRLGIAGVALAVDAMLVVGIAVMLWQARAYVQFSLRRLFAAPTVALLAGLGLALVAFSLAGTAAGDWITGTVKAVAFLTGYIATLFLLERTLIVGTLLPTVRELVTRRRGVVLRQ